MIIIFLFFFTILDESKENCELFINQGSAIYMSCLEIKQFQSVLNIVSSFVSEINYFILNTMQSIINKLERFIFIYHIKAVYC